MAMMTVINDGIVQKKKMIMTMIMIMMLMIMMVMMMRTINDGIV